MDERDGALALEQIAAREVATLRQRVAELEAELASSRNASVFLESVLRAVPAFIMQIDPEQKIRFVNRYQPGHTPESAIGREIFTYMAEADREVARQHIELARQTGQVTSYTLRHAAGPNGQPASYLTRVAPIPEPDGRVGACLAFVDITEEEQRARALEEAQAKLTLALDATGLGLWSWDARTQQTVWDERMCALHGRDDAQPVATYGDVCVHPDDRELYEQAVRHTLETGHFQQRAVRIVRPDGSIRWVLAVGKVHRDGAGNVTSIVGGSLDVTRQRDLEEQVRKSQRMAAISSLTAGVAHNFNNMLAVISPIIELAAELVPPEHRRMMEDASHAAQRAAELVRQLMTYAGHVSSPKFRSCELGTLTHAAMGICRRSFAPSITLRLEQRVPRVWVSCNSGQLEQVLVNLLLNARDAIDEAQAGEGTITVRIRMADEHEIEAAGLVRDGTVEWACIDTIDDGPGVSNEVRARLFEPFFTTKPFGKGTGLGLPTSFAIARDHGGTLVCARSPERGACFTLMLPLVQTPAHESTEPPPVAVPAGTEILVVDDDDAMRRTLSRVLAAHELRVREASSGESAVQTLRAYPSTQLVVLDRAMPGGSGESFIPRIREIARTARIVFLSGHAVPPELAQAVDAVVAKPVTGSELLAVMGRLLTVEPNS